MKKILLVMSLISVLILAGCNKNENVENANIPETTNIQQQEKIINQESTENVADETIITKESLEDFLSLMVGNKKNPYNIFDEVTDPMLSTDDSSTFMRIIRILFNINKYEKVGDTYYFDLEDVKEYAKKYFDKDEFLYDTDNDINFDFNKETNKYESILGFGLFEEILDVEKPVVENYNISGDLIDVDCSVITTYYSGTAKITYLIVLARDDNSYVIKSITMK